jgi:hypothetical protein
MLSDTDAACVDICCGCVKTKGKDSQMGRSMVLTETTTHTHTHTHTHTQTHKSYNRLNVVWAKRQQQFVVVPRSNIWSAAQDCSPTFATTNTNSTKQSPTVSVYPLGYAIWTVEMFLKTWYFRFRHVYCRYCAIVSTEYSMDISQYCLQNIRWLLLSTVNRISNGHCSKLSTEYSMNIHNFWDSTMKTIAPDWHNILRTPSILNWNCQ